MMKLITVVAACLVISSCIVHATDEIGCSYNERRHGLISISIPRRRIVTVYIECIFDDNAVISSADTKFSNERNETVTTLIGTEIKGIQYLPQDISDVFPYLKEIRVEETYLASLSKKYFQGLRNLTVLNLEKNQISSIDEDSFDDLEQIYRMNLNENKLTSLPANVFAKLSTLDTLYLNGNQLTSLDAGIFKHNPNLALLFLNENKFTTFDPETFSTLTKMRQIWLHRNEITALNTQWFKNCESLSDLNLSDNNYTEIPLDFISSLSSLSEVSFSRNPITTFDFALFQNNTNIYQIFLNGLKLKRVLNVDIVDQLTDMRGLFFIVKNDACVTGEYHEGNLEKLKGMVKQHCQVE